MTPNSHDAALALLRRIEQHIDAIVCYASTMDEHEPNRLAVDLRAYLATHPAPVSAEGEADWAEVMANVAEAYGLLWGCHTDNTNVHEARKMLLRCLSKNGQEIGISQCNARGKNQFNDGTIDAIANHAASTSPGPSITRDEMMRHIASGINALGDFCSAEEVAQYVADDLIATGCINVRKE